MLYDSDWQLEQVRSYRIAKGRDPSFVSDWDCDVPEFDILNSIVTAAIKPSIGRMLNYSYAEDQTAQREMLAAYLNDVGRLPITVDEVSLALNATNALYLCLTTLCSEGINRFLVVTPAYYTVVETLLSAKVSIIFHHLCDCDDFAFDFGAIEGLIEEQHIQALILTDPIYSAGISVPVECYRKLAEICALHDVWLVCDHSLGGLHWKAPVALIDFAKMRALRIAPKSVFIDSLAKRLCLNGFKHAVIIGPGGLIRQVHDLASRVSGGFCSTQIAVLDALYSKEHENALIQYMDSNRKRIRDQYNLLAAALCGTSFALYKSDTGHFSMICHTKARIRDVDTKNIVKHLLGEHGLYVLPSEHFYYYKDNRFGFRINLINEFSRLLPIICRAITQDSDFLHNVC